MDQGPVDAGPTSNDEYNYGARSPSPSEVDRPERRREKARATARPTIHANHSGLKSNRITASGQSSRKHSSESLRDQPLYRRIGDDMRSSVKSDDAEMLTEKDHADPAIPADTGRLYKFTLYETNTRYWITGVDLTEKQYRVLRIDRTSAPGQLDLLEDKTTYTVREMNEVLISIDDGNKSTGGLRKKFQFWGVLGFIRFTEAYYMLIVTKRQQVAMIGGHYIYQIESTELVPLTTGSSSRFARDRGPEETRLLNIFNNLILSKSFYFSYGYDITNTLQHNIIRQRQAVNAGQSCASNEFNSMFIWNSHLLQPALSALEHPFTWCLPIIHGFIDQATLDIFGRAVYITIIGRRSRFFAGARFLKRGVNDKGYVANDVETEQIVSEQLTTSFHAPGPRLFANPTYTSFVQHRGSIPLYWTQDNSGVSPKPDINLNLLDPFYQPAALHFDNLFERYGCRVYVLNLIKARERTPRESKLLAEFQMAIEYLNQSLPEDKKILYKAFDMSREAKTRGGDVIGSLEVIAKEMVARTGFFRNGDANIDNAQVQNGVARTNCIDCLDRTNAAQFVLGKRAFALQLQALGVIDRDEVEYDTDAVNVFTHMFHDHGDTIAVQYGGSHLVNTMATYRKLNHWQSSSRDMVESFKRYYHNSFLDNQRQEAYNLFLGNYVWSQGEPMLWDLPSDYYLHHSSPRGWLDRQKRGYIWWFTPQFLERRSLPPVSPILQEADRLQDAVREHDDYWTETYRPTTLSTLGKVYSFRIASESRFLPERPRRDSKSDFSPFKIRIDPHRQSIDSPDKRILPRRGVRILDPIDDASIMSASSSTYHQDESAGREPSISSVMIHEPVFTRTWTTPTILPTMTGTLQPISQPTTAAASSDKTIQHLQALEQIHTQSLRPSVSVDEAHEYERYISHPLNLPLIVADEQPSDAQLDFVQYLQRPANTASDAQFVPKDDLHQFWEFLHQRPNPLTVTEDDLGKKRYKAYRQWLRGKSLFKQSKIDPEFRAEV